MPDDDKMLEQALEAQRTILSPVNAQTGRAELSREDARLDALWRETFGEPMPILGAPAVVTAILREHGVAVRQSPRNNTTKRTQD